MLYAGDDWAEDHHDVALVDGAGRRLARAPRVSVFTTLTQAN